MGDICVIYAHADAMLIPPALERLFKPRWTVWWDEKIKEGDYRQAILSKLASASCVIPIWSEGAQFSAVLHDEVRAAQSAGVPILPIRIQDVPAPLGFGTLQAVNMLGWTGEPRRSELSEFTKKVEEILVGRRTAKGRPAIVPDYPSVPLPGLFYSVSSHETRLDPEDALNVLQLFGSKSILISAYDFREEPRRNIMIKRIKKLRRDGALVLLDSGNYEKARLNDKRWTLRTFRDALRAAPHDMAFCYDDLSPPSDFNSIISGVLKAVARDSKWTDKPILPIVHLPRDTQGNHKIEWAPSLIRAVAGELESPFVAIPERELGPGIFSRAATMLKIRAALRDLGKYQPVHVLGTGNPISIALLAAAGADSFDGLEWCRFVADSDTATLHKFDHYDLFSWQDQFASSQVTYKAAVDSKISQTGKTVFHNLDFYTDWMNKLRGAMDSERRLVEFMTRLLSKSVMEDARAALPGVL